MIRYTKGNLLESDAEALVNAVNTVGVMGKGIALAFIQAFPENYRRYAAACKRGEVRVGQMFVTEGPAIGGPRWIINFPTKQYWRDPSQGSWVRDGLGSPRREIEVLSVRTIAIPALGCGYGGLDWETRVRPMIEESRSWALRCTNLAILRGFPRSLLDSWTWWSRCCPSARRPAPRCSRSATTSSRTETSARIPR